MQFFHNIDLKVLNEAKAPSDPLPLFKGQGLVCLVVAVGEPWLTKKTPVEQTTIGVTDVLPRFDEKKKNRTEKSALL